MVKRKKPQYSFTTEIGEERKGILLRATEGFASVQRRRAELAEARRKATIQSLKKEKELLKARGDVVSERERIAKARRNGRVGDPGKALVSNGFDDPLVLPERKRRRR